jgi:hypothetical protein
MELLSYSDVAFLEVAFAGSLAYSLQQYSSRWRKPAEPLIPNAVESLRRRRTLLYFLGASMP